MDGDVRTLAMSRYKDLIESIDSLHTAQLLQGRKVSEAYVTFHDQAVEGKLGWNIFYGDAKFALAYENIVDNKIIITLRKLVNEDLLMNALGDDLRFGILSDTHNVKTVITLKIDFKIDKESVTKIVKLLDTSFSL
ncbi:hypothetical protein D3C81_428180 [compost metagenome]